MPSTQDIMQLGALGVLLIINLLAVVKGVPWVLGRLLDSHKQQVDGLVAAFKGEVQKERDAGQAALKEERDANAKNTERLAGAIDGVRQSVESLRNQVTKPIAQ